MNPTDFYTVPRSEEGLRVPLLLPNDQDSGEWLLIHGPDSEAFARSQAILLRRGGEGCVGDLVHACCLPQAVAVAAHTLASASGRAGRVSSHSRMSNPRATCLR